MDRAPPLSISAPTTEHRLADLMRQFASGEMPRSLDARTHRSGTVQIDEDFRGAATVADMLLQRRPLLPALPVA